MTFWSIPLTKARCCSEKKIRVRDCSKQIPITQYLFIRRFQPFDRTGLDGIVYDDRRRNNRKLAYARHRQRVWHQLLACQLLVRGHISLVETCPVTQSWRGEVAIYDWAVSIGLVNNQRCR